MTRIIFVNRFFWPDHSATSQILSDLAFHLADEGREVHVVTSRLLYEGAAGGALLPAQERVRGVGVHRVSTSAFGRKGLAGRAADYGSFYVAARRKLLALAGPGDIVVAKTDPPLLSLVAADVARRRSAMLVNWIQDLYPEVAQNLGVAWLKGPLGGALTALRDRSLRQAAANVAIGEAMARRLLALGVSPDSVETIPNWVVSADIHPVEAEDNPLRRAWGLQERFVVGYSGNLGRAHEYRTLLDAAASLADRPELRFLFVGGGHRFQALEQDVRARGLAHLFLFKPYQGQEALSLSLSTPDVHWVSLLPEVEGLIVPSKVYGVAAVGRPILAVADPQGEVGQLVTRHACGIAVAPGDAVALAVAILRLQSDPAERAGMGANALAMLREHYSRDRALAAWSALLHRLGATAAPAAETPVPASGAG